MDCVRLHDCPIGIYSGDDVFHVARMLARSGKAALREIERRHIGVGLRAGWVASRLSQSTDASLVRILDTVAIQGRFWLLTEHLVELDEEQATDALRKIGLMPPAEPEKVRKPPKNRTVTVEELMTRPLSWTEIFGERKTRKKEPIR